MKHKLLIGFVIFISIGFIALLVAIGQETYVIEDVIETKVSQSAPLIITEIKAKGDKNIGAVSLFDSIDESKIRESDLGACDFEIIFNNGTKKNVPATRFDKFPYRVGDEFINEVETTYYTVKARNSGDKYEVNTKEQLTKGDEIKYWNLVDLKEYKPDSKWIHHNKTTNVIVDYKVYYRVGLAHKSKDLSFSITLN